MRFISILFLFSFSVVHSQSRTISGIKKMIFIEGKSPAVESFYMDETPVTYEDFEKYAEAGGEKNAYWYYDSYHISYQPVTGISWHTAVDYCNWRSICEGLKPVYIRSEKLDFWGYPVYERDLNADGYQLPSSLEFQWAASGGNNSLVYPWGDVFVDSLANYDTDRGHKTTTWWRLAPVTSQYCTASGLYNVCGNNWHWCDDWTDTSSRRKNLAGGSWGAVNAKYLEIKNLSHSSPGNYNYDIGFRCIRYAKNVKEETISVNYKTPYTFLTGLKSNHKKIISNYYTEEFITRLSDFISDNYPHCINFLMQIDEQEILTPQQIAFEITAVCKKHKVNPLFLTSIMISESGFGTVSFPRWFNNPMAYHWQNKLMERGYPVYEAKPNVQNRKYKKLADGFNAFCIGIRRELYYKAAMKNLDAFHMIYVGYRADEWMHTLSRVFRDIAGQRLEPLFPEKDAGKMIYGDWEEIKMNL